MRKRKIFRLAQMPPEMPGAPLDAGMPPLGGPSGMPPPPMPGMPPGMPPMPGMPGAPAPDAPKDKIGSPLTTVFEILYDADVLNKIKGSGRDTDELSEEIWRMYGGTETGGINSEKLGTRSLHKNISPEEEQEEMDATDEYRWKRLPLGKNIGDITTLEELRDSIVGIMSGLKKPPAPPGGGMPPPMAKIIPTIIKLANIYDKYGKVSEASVLDKILK